MITSIDKIAELALALTRDERAALADRLVESLEPTDDDLIAQVWVAEAKRRLEEIRSGAVEAIELDAVKTRIGAALR